MDMQLSGTEAADDPAVMVVSMVPVVPRKHDQARQAAEALEETKLEHAAELAARVAETGHPDVPPGFDSNDMSYDNLMLLDEHLKACTYTGATTTCVLGMKTVRIDSVRRSVLQALQALARATRTGSQPPRELQCTGCSICLDDFSKDEHALQLPCGHLFHGACIGKWLATSRACPNCRKGDGIL